MKSSLKYKLILYYLLLDVTQILKVGKLIMLGLMLINIHRRYWEDQMNLKGLMLIIFML
jgi:hypothetical protein